MASRLRFALVRPVGGNVTRSYRNRSAESKSSSAADAAHGRAAHASAPHEICKTGFWIGDGSVLFRPSGKGADEPPTRVCPPLHVLAYVRDSEQDNWGLLLEWLDRDGHTHRWALPEIMFKGSGEEMRGELLRQGFRVPIQSDRRNLFMAYLDQARPNQRARSVERTGWHGEGAARVFVLPDRTVGTSDQLFYFPQSENQRDRVYRQAGELSGWRSDVADLCRGNSRLLFAVSSGFAAMLLDGLGEESGGFHFRGASSTGKSTALLVAASVFGGPDFKKQWRATSNALESVAALHNDALLPLDELAQVDPKEAGAIAYLLANSVGKMRSHRNGAARPVLRWRILFLSAGEVSLAEHMRQDGRRAQAGQETRLAEIPADAGRGLGLFENLHGYGDAAAFSRALCASAAQSYGSAAPAFIEAVLRYSDALSGELRRLREAFVRSVLASKADGQAHRVASRFALVAAAGELATRWGITGWHAGEADSAARTCFGAWLEVRGGAANVEPARMVAQVRSFLERHGDSRFAPWKDDGSGEWVTKDRAGFRKAFVQDGTLESADGFYVLRETFRNEICTGFDPLDVSRALADAGVLDRDVRSRKYTKRVRLPNLGKTACYVILPAIWQTGDDTESSANAADSDTP